MEEKVLCYALIFILCLVERENVMFCKWIIFNYHVNKLIISNELEATSIIMHTDLKDIINLDMLQVLVLFVIRLDTIVKISVSHVLRNIKFIVLIRLWHPT